MAQSHSSGRIMWITIIIAIGLIALVVPLTQRNYGSAADASRSGEDADVRIQPVARFELARADTAASGPKSPQDIYNGVCGACHNTGAAGAPRIDDKAAWAPRVATGKAALYQSALAGKGAMPPKGGASVSDEEIKATVDYILGKVK